MCSCSQPDLLICRGEQECNPYMTRNRFYLVGTNKAQSANEKKCHLAKDVI